MIQNKLIKCPKLWYSVHWNFCWDKTRDQKWVLCTRKRIWVYGIKELHKSNGERWGCVELLCGDVTTHLYPSPQQWLFFTFLFSNVTPGYVLIIYFIVYIAKYKWSFPKKKSVRFFHKKRNIFQAPLATWKGVPVALLPSLSRWALRSIWYFRRIALLLADQRNVLVVNTSCRIVTTLSPIPPAPNTISLYPSTYVLLLWASSILFLHLFLAYIQSSGIFHNLWSLLEFRLHLSSSIWWPHRASLKEV